MTLRVETMVFWCGCEGVGFCLKANPSTVGNEVGKNNMSMPVELFSPPLQQAINLESHTPQIFHPLHQRTFSIASANLLPLPSSLCLVAIYI
jgi:hypothetical protein